MSPKYPPELPSPSELLSDGVESCMLPGDDGPSYEQVKKFPPLDSTAGDFVLSPAGQLIRRYLLVCGDVSSFFGILKSNGSS